MTMEEQASSLLGIGTENIFNRVSIRIASPEIIMSWSRGEVKTPETINYRTFKPEKDGLFCERIFGPTRDWECSCGKYKRIKHKGVICDRCGVEVTQSKVRRERMGRISLAVPVVHVWFLRNSPYPISNVLDLTMTELEKVTYYENYIVTDPGKTPLKSKELLNEARYQKLRQEHGNGFTAMMGGEAIRELLRREDLEKLSQELKEKLNKSKSQQTKIKLARRLRIVENFRLSGIKPEWMVLGVIPVIPPELRPLVPLEGGRFATSDLNDLYRRVINRNNRLNNILHLKTPEVIVRNEKRMLQEVVDSLFDNSKQTRPVHGSSNRPLKSLSDNLRGKPGRFRQNLLGKRVDYSGRAVIVVGPELKLHQCGLPKEMALELFEPFIINRLKEMGFVNTIKSAKKMIERQEKIVWDVLDEVIKDHPVMLNRAPTLHRLGIQAFEPVLIEGKSIRIHPLVCAAFNADFDGDQMAVHVPLSSEARLEAKILMSAPNNIFSPASGEPIDTPSQDITLGCYYLTRADSTQEKIKRNFSSEEEVLHALAEKVIGLHEMIHIQRNGEMIDTTAGRVIFNQIFPPEVGFINRQMTKKEISDVITRCFEVIGLEETVKVLDRIKDLGFENATRSGLSLGMQDMIVSPQKGRIIQQALKEVEKVHQQRQEGVITGREHSNKVVDIWSHASEELAQSVFQSLKVAGVTGLNPLFMLVDSGARGSRLQVQQLAGMRGLMAKPSGEIIEHPIISNFREGMNVLEYFISTHGARKGLADTALKTADSGYLTRKLVDVAQDLIITTEDCGTIKGREVAEMMGQDEMVISLKERITGRFSLNNIKDSVSGKVIVKSGEEITPELAEELEKRGLAKVKIRSALTCEATEGLCVKCYGRNLATRRMAVVGDPVGIIAAQSIGEPGTQLTMRTFHIGGTASLFARQPEVRVKNSGVVKYDRLKTVSLAAGNFRVLNKEGTIAIYDSDGPAAQELERYKIEVGSEVFIPDGGKIEKKQLLAAWDPYNIPILTEVDGKVEYLDLIKDKTFEIQVDRVTGTKELVVKQLAGADKHPQIVIKNPAGEVLAYCSLPAGAHVEVGNGKKVKAGDRMARLPRKITKTKDITGGLPRITELLEARKPKESAEIAKISGRVEFGARMRGKLKLMVKDPDTGNAEEHLISQGQHITVQKGDWVEKGQQLTEGPIVLQELLDVCGMEDLQEYLVNQVQEVYRFQGVSINDKHIEIIVRQMVDKVKVIDPGDTNFLYEEAVSRFRFAQENERVKNSGGRPAKSTNLLLGVSKSALSTESFISAASFQETTRILTEAAISGKVDNLKGFKENVIMGHLIPAGTGYPAFKKLKVSALEEGQSLKKLKE